VFTEGTFDGRITANLASALSRPVEEVRKAYFAKVEELELGRWGLDTFWEWIQQQLPGAGLASSEFRRIFLSSVQENAAMYDLLPRLPDSVELGLLSNNYPELSTLLRADPRWSRFRALIFSNELGHKKPAEQAFLALLRGLGCPAEHCLFVDDVLENLEAAAALGFQVLQYREHQTFTAGLTELGLL
jgi:putative hydrolase of the HAD superfamily